MAMTRALSQLLTTCSRCAHMAAHLLIAAGDAHLQHERRAARHAAADQQRLHAPAAAVPVARPHTRLTCPPCRACDPRRPGLCIRRQGWLPPFACRQTRSLRRCAPAANAQAAHSAGGHAGQAGGQVRAARRLRAHRARFTARTGRVD